MINWVSIPASYAVLPPQSIRTNPGFWSLLPRLRAGNPIACIGRKSSCKGCTAPTSSTSQASLDPGLRPMETKVSFNEVVDFSNGAGSTGSSRSGNDWGTFGIPGVGLPNDNNSAAAFATYLYFPAPGTYIMGGNSDDGVYLTFAKNSQDVLGTAVPGMLGGEGGRGIGSFQNSGAVIVTNAGYYGFRLLYWNGGGGSGVEWCVPDSKRPLA